MDDRRRILRARVFLLVATDRTPSAWYGVGAGSPIGDLCRAVTASELMRDLHADPESRQKASSQVSHRGADANLPFLKAIFAVELIFMVWLLGWGWRLHEPEFVQEELR